MVRLSQLPGGAMKKIIYDAIIVGSGAGAGPLAYYLCRAGKQVLMLEAGRAWRAEEYPDNELDANRLLAWNGGMDPTQDANTIMIRGKALGGGTVLNQGFAANHNSIDRKSTRLNSSHVAISYAVFCLKR